MNPEVADLAKFIQTPLKHKPQGHLTFVAGFEPHLMNQVP